MSFTSDGGVASTTVRGLILEKFSDRVASLLNRPTVFAQMLGVGQCKNAIIWDVRSGTAAPGDSVQADGADITTYGKDTITKASLYPGNYVQAFAVSDAAYLDARNSGNPLQMANLLDFYLTPAIEKLAVDIATDIYTGTGAANTILGLLYSAGTASGDINGGMLEYGTYASVARASVTQFIGNTDRNGGTARELSIPLMRTMDRKVYTASGRAADFIVCDPIQFEKYGNLLGLQRRYLQDVTIRGRKIVLDAGFKALEFDGTPVFRDALCPAGYMLWVHSGSVHLLQEDDPEATLAIAGSYETQFQGGPTGFRAHFTEIGRLGLARRFAVWCRPQVQVECPNWTGVLADLAS